MTATEKTTSAPAPSDARTGLAREATAEIESLCTVLLRELSNVGPEDYALRGMVIRVKDLNSVVMSVVCDDDARDTEEMHHAVHGTWLGVQQ
jgi:hypothetical protein